MRRIILFGLLLGLVFSFFPPLLRAETNNDETIRQLQQQIDTLEQQIQAARRQQVSLRSQLHYLNSQIDLTNLRVQQTKIEIHLLQKQIAELSGKVDRLDKNLNDIGAIFLTRVISDYKLRRISPLELFFASRNFTEFLTMAKYYQVLQDNDRRLMFRLEETRMNYDLQKKEKKQKQKELASLEKRLKQQENLLAERKASKERLLTVTKNNEQRYQFLLAQAIKQLNSLRSFASHRGGGLLPPQPSPDGWYYNQRDQRWGNNFIGASKMRIWEVGCLVTSVAMLFSKDGQRRTPADIAANLSYFFADTAYMLLPWPAPTGYHLVRRGADFNFLNHELALGRPVIAHLNIGNHDGHFVVIKKRQGNDYIINDPWYGPDMKLSDRYSKYQITSLGSYLPN